MNTWRSLVCLVAFALALPAFARAQVVQLSQFQDGQVASASAVNDNFRALEVQIVKQQRPGFLRKPNEAQKILIPATATQAGRVAIDNQVLSFTQSIEIDLTTSGRGGLDTGVVQPSKLYYVYAVLGAAGPPTVSATASLNPPTQGPANFGTQWTYLGACITDSASALSRFTFSRGRCERFTGPVVQTSSVALTQLTLLVPAHATEVRGRFTVSGSPIGSFKAVTAGPNANNTHQVVLEQNAATPVTAFAFVSLPLFDGPSIVMSVNDPALTGTFETYGWIEDPTLFQ